MIPARSGGRPSLGDAVGLDTYALCIICNWFRDAWAALFFGGVGAAAAAAGRLPRERGGSRSNWPAPPLDYPQAPDGKRGAVFALNKRSGTTTIRATPSISADTLARPPNGTRLPYKGTTEVDGVTWYYVAPPGKPAGWVDGRDTVGSRPANTPAPIRIELVDSGISSETPPSSGAIGGRG